MLSNPNYDFSVIELKKKENYLSTGCQKLDRFLRGGISCKGITQIYGESGTGKTQLALQLCLTAQVHENCSKYSYGAAYICTEAVFPSSRLHHLLQNSPIAKKYSISNEMIFIEHISTTEDLENCIFNNERLPCLLSKYNIKLLVIDSIAATYRVDYESCNLKSRAKSLRNIGYQLHKLANVHNMAVVCINQVTANIDPKSMEHISTKEHPSLGITWASMITNSLYMHKKNNQRYLHVKGSSHLPYTTIEYQILDSGFVAKGS